VFSSAEFSVFFTLTETTENKTSTTTTADIRASLNHPVVDADGRWLEYTPLMSEQKRRLGGDKAVEGFQQQRSLVHGLLDMSVAQRRDERLCRMLIMKRRARR